MEEVFKIVQWAQEDVSYEKKSSELTFYQSVYIDIFISTQPEVCREIRKQVNRCSQHRTDGRGQPSIYDAISPHGQFFRQKQITFYFSSLPLVRRISYPLTPSTGERSIDTYLLSLYLICIHLHCFLYPVSFFILYYFCLKKSPQEEEGDVGSQPFI